MEEKHLTYYNSTEEKLNVITHGIGLVLSIIALVFTVQNWLGGGMSLVLAFFLSIIELLVAALQAYIFTLLSALYFGFAVVEHELDYAH